jgi:hypothetical protein
MAEEAKKTDLLDTFLNYGNRIGDVYAKVKLADKGVAQPTVIYETNGSNDPLVRQGQAANVQGNDPLNDLIAKVSGNAATAYSAKQFSDSMPYVVGGLAFAVAIYLLVKNK